MYLTDMLIDWLCGLPRDVRFAVEGRLRMRGPVWLFRNTTTEDDESVVKALQAVDADVQILDIAETITTILDQPIDTDDPERWGEAKRQWEAIREKVTYDRQLDVYVLRGVKHRILLHARVDGRTPSAPAGSIYDVQRESDEVTIGRFDLMDSLAPLNGAIPTGMNGGTNRDAEQFYYCWRAAQKSGDASRQTSAAPGGALIRADGLLVE